MPSIRRVQRLEIETAAIDRRADDERVQMAVARRPVEAERVVAVPEAEGALDGERFVPLAAPPADPADARMRSMGAADLAAASPIVITEAQTRTDRGEARFER